MVITFALTGCVGYTVDVFNVEHSTVEVIAGPFFNKPDLYPDGSAIAAAANACQQIELEREPTHASTKLGQNSGGAWWATFVFRCMDGDE